MLDKYQGGESRGINEGGHGISCRWSDKSGKKIKYIFLNKQSITMQQIAKTSLLFEANAHYFFPIMYNSFLHKSKQSRKTENKLCSDLSENLKHIVEHFCDEYLPGIMRRYVHFIA